MYTPSRFVREDLPIIRRLAALLASPSAGARIRKFYDFCDFYDPSGEVEADGYFLNLGYWQPGSTTLKEAAEAMAALLAERAGFEPGDKILDAGCGYGSQDFYWAKNRNPGHITGIDLAPTHIQGAVARASREGLSDTLSFQEGSATELKLQGGQFDRVVALESSFHFLTREDFFREAHRFLRPGGVLALADIIPLDKDASDDGKVLELSDLNVPAWQRFIPKVNWYPASSYVDRLRRAGFVNIDVKSIRDQVYGPWAEYLGKVINSDIPVRGLGKVLLAQARREHPTEKDLRNVDYVIVVAEKPGPAH